MACGNFPESCSSPRRHEKRQFGWRWVSGRRMRSTCGTGRTVRIVFSKRTARRPSAADGATNRNDEVPARSRRRYLKDRWRWFVIKSRVALTRPIPPSPIEHSRTSPAGGRSRTYISDQLAKAPFDQGTPNGYMTPPEEIRAAARVHVPILITEPDRQRRSLCARLIHATGERVRGPFVAFSANGTKSLHALLLRHQFDQARGGTLFVEDIATLSSDAQALLMTLLNERAHHQIPGAVGSSGVRIVAGASRHLDAERATGAFCEQLFYRLNVIHIDLSSRQTSSSPPREAARW